MYDLYFIYNSSKSVRRTKSEKIHGIVTSFSKVPVKTSKNLKVLGSVKDVPELRLDIHFGLTQKGRQVTVTLCLPFFLFIIVPVCSYYQIYIVICEMNELEEMSTCFRS